MLNTEMVIILLLLWVSVFSSAITWRRPKVLWVFNGYKELLMFTRLPIKQPSWYMSFFSDRCIVWQSRLIRQILATRMRFKTQSRRDQAKCRFYFGENEEELKVYLERLEHFFVTNRLTDGDESQKQCISLLSAERFLWTPLKVSDKKSDWY